jgi:glycosyltransferase involved in cell wall biosynthesis
MLMQLKVLFITPRFYPEIGGVEKHCYMVTQELSKHGIQVNVITGSLDHKLLPKERQNNLQIYRIFFKKKNNRNLFTILNLVKPWIFLLKNFQILIRNDIIHLHDFQTFLWLCPFLIFFKKNIFITFHGFESYPISRYSRVIRKIAEQTLAGSICVGDFIIKWYGAKPEYITLGASEIHSLLTNPVDKAAVFVGRLTNDSGVLDLIKAIEILKKNYAIQLSLHICGDGQLRKTIEETAKDCGLEIHIHGFVTTPKEYVISSRYVFATGYLSILEAMTLKKPVFSFYNNPLKRDYLYSFPEAEKLMVIASSPEDLAEKIFRAVENPDQTNLLVEHAYEFACEQTWDKVANLYLKLYRERC